MVQLRTGQLGRIKNNQNFISNVNPFAGPSSWTPVKLFASGIQGFWLDTSDATSLFQDSAATVPVTNIGQPIGAIRDKSGRGNHFQQTIAANRPTVQLDSAGFLNAVLDGVNDCWSSVITLNLAAADKVTVVVGVTKTSDAAPAIISEHSADYNLNSRTFYLAAPAGAGTNDFVAGARGSAGVVAGLVATVAGKAAPVSGVLTAIHDIVGDSSILRFNSVASAAAVADKGIGTFGDFFHFIGARNGAAFPLSGCIYQVIVINGLLTDADLALTEKFVGAKMGIGL